MNNRYEGALAFWERIKVIAEMIKFEHTIFALPFAFMGAFLAADGSPGLMICLWVLLAMIGGRSAAMAFNRLVDAELDARNPRTANRALPAGLIHKKEVHLFTLCSSALLIFAAWRLNPLAFGLSFPVLGILFLYSYTKRFTSACHFVLGFCLGLTPLGGWIAVKVTIELPPILLSLGVLLWTAGFDLIYACQDYEVDQKEGLHSIPARFGMRGALVLSALLHGGTILLFAQVGLITGLGIPYWIALSLTLVFLIYEHAIVKPSDLSKVNMAFFMANGVISIAMAAGTYLSLAL
ncbi:MAG: putative 4-hydroxybenzoate polyprenyltransferase [Planctomycetes bacterium]|nr:putative 4-hydroxybenzoate polyprenyltransferase [Planctomycetota bacterium]